MISSGKFKMIVLFQEYLYHILRILRILMQPGGNCLLIGSAGVGKQAICKISSYLLGYDIEVMVDSHNDIELENFHEFLKIILK